MYWKFGESCIGVRGECESADDQRFVTKSRKADSKRVEQLHLQELILRNLDWCSLFMAIGIPHALTDDVKSEEIKVRGLMTDVSKMKSSRNLVWYQKS